MNYILLILGFILLIKGADFFVEGSSSVARLLKVPSVIIGLTVVAMGTSAPEAAVSISAGIAGSNDIALSNVIGSNVFNLLVVIGVCAAICAFEVDSDIMRRDIPVNIVISILLVVFLLNEKISRAEGVILFLGIIIYLVIVVREALRSRKTAGEEVKMLSPVLSILYIAGGLVAIVIGGDMVVDSASDIAAHFGMSENLIGLTIVAVGTSLPELVTSIVASTKGESGLALGNAVGSCIFNILFILGMSATLSPLSGTMENVIDGTVLIAITVLIAVFGYTTKKVKRWEGIVMILVYAAYMAYVIMR